MKDRKLGFILKGGGLFLLLAALTGWLVLREYDASQLLEAARQADLRFLLPAGLAMAFFLLCEGQNIGRGLSMLGYNITLKQKLHYAFAGFFFSSVTPSASGGQPMQLFFMCRDRVAASHGSLALLMELTSFQIVSIGAALLGLLLETSRTLASAGQIKYLFLLGLSLNLGVLAILLIALFSQSLIRRLLGLLLPVCRRLFPKKAVAQKRKLLRFAASYRRAARCLKARPAIAAKLLLTSALQLLAFYSIPYFIYLSLGLSHLSAAGIEAAEAAGAATAAAQSAARAAIGAGAATGAGFGWLQIAAIQALLYVSVSALPLPGAVGVTEGGFSVLFQAVFPPALMGCAMVLSRIASFYLPLMGSGLALAWFSANRSGNRSDKQAGDRSRKWAGNQVDSRPGKQPGNLSRCGRS